MIWALDNILVNFYNQNLAGRPTGPNQNVTVNCQGTGNVNISGTTSYDASHGITSASPLVYTMTNCQASVVSSDGSLSAALTLTGVMNENGSWNAPSYASVAYQANANLGMTGTITSRGFAPATISQSCSVGFSSSISSTSNTLVGTVCGRPASVTGQ